MVIAVFNSNHHMIIIIVIDKTATFEPQPSLKDSATLRSVFTSLVSQRLFLNSKDVNLASNHQPGGSCSYIYVS
jgi:hypothetical protein